MGGVACAVQSAGADAVVCKTGATNAKSGSAFVACSADADCAAVSPATVPPPPANPTTSRPTGLNGGTPRAGAVGEVCVYQVIRT